ncbi:MAG: hypothetical protein AAFN94_00845 [Pseudomonadota bacterium]
MSAVDILAAIEAQHKAAMDNMVEVDVPEWDAKLYFRPILTVARRKQINAGIKADDEGAILASYIIHEARDKNGEPMFEANATTRATLEGKADITLMQRIVGKVKPSDTVDDAKNV